ncbi:MAG: 50S ribosomal protein L17 [Candidatus Omnitrophica bacterium]|nr:50S ribosomal protein L17 [Candidatus Omnitrophota bacterium]HOX54744.1 50S ribosomal protein L17 [Candidatus Omnitrophota bacterium]
MRHRNANKRLARNTSLRKATVRDLAKSVLLHQSIKTTELKAKEARRLVDRLISWGKRGDLSAKRLAYSVLCDHSLVSLLFNDIAPRFKNRNGGYTRVIKWTARRGDNAQSAILELTELKIKEKIHKPKAKEEHHEKKEKEQLPVKEKPVQEKDKAEAQAKPQVEKKQIKESKPPKKFIGGFGKFFKKERDSL